MSTYQRLLLICDPVLHPSAAMARAQALAGALGASLHLLALGSLPPGLRVLDNGLQIRAREEALEHQQAWLREQVERLRGLGIDASAEAIWSEEPLHEVLQQVQARAIDLLIKDSQYEPALSRALMAPLDWQLLRQCPVPLHLVSRADHPLPRRVLAAIDLSQDDPQVEALNERIVEAAQQLAECCAAELHLLDAYDLSASFLAYAAGPVAWSPEVQEEVMGRANQRMARFGSRYGVPLECQHLVQGAATRMIAEFAGERHMDVVVMGTLYHAGLAKIIGSTTEQALYRVKSSILAIRP